MQLDFSLCLQFVRLWSIVWTFSHHSLTPMFNDFSLSLSRWIVQQNRMNFTSQQHFQLVHNKYNGEKRIYALHPYYWQPENKTFALHNVHFNCSKLLPVTTNTSEREHPNTVNTNFYPQCVRSIWLHKKLTLEHHFKLWWLTQNIAKTTTQHQQCMKKRPEQVKNKEKLKCILISGKINDVSQKWFRTNLCWMRVISNFYPSNFH